MVEWSERSRVYFSDLHRYIQRYPRPLEAFCHAWVDATRAVREFAAESENVVELRYEDLVADPEKEMGRVLEFVGESWDPALIHRALNDEEAGGFSDWKTFSKTAVDDSSIGRWRSIPSGMISELAEIVNPTLVECGYEPAPIKPPPSAEQARRRYDLGLMMQKAKRE